jgi:hypothetical protein
MVAIQKGFDSGSTGAAIEQVISKAEQEKEDWEGIKLEAEGKIETLDYIIAQQNRLLRTCRRGVIPVVDSSFDSVTKRDLENRSVREILVFLAKENEGIVKGLEAVRVLMRTGVIPDRKSADAQVYTVLNREKETFSKLEPGVYQLTGISDPANDLPF